MIRFVRLGWRWTSRSDPVTPPTRGRRAHSAPWPSSAFRCRPRRCTLGTGPLIIVAEVSCVVPSHCPQTGPGFCAPPTDWRPFPFARRKRKVQFSKALDPYDARSTNYVGTRLRALASEPKGWTLEVGRWQAGHPKEKAAWRFSSLPFNAHRIRRFSGSSPSSSSLLLDAARQKQHILLALLAP
ncbi:hypothetical protein MPTK1_6g03860 [Marchantia polymorpha subsp. ruderalis]|uniref:Uncharacterized protein n=2 Tax=Marchantia polymorpha TaxID=3197 RepID=A0AAF6BN97_MARPO|nr:hypothetical protein MARPO_0034s0132 [Marchantia polymorpha]BBN13481.1 hypothetical protein Mp_6g03860 [Marchantia polymorpha subsp. ruderalis]|eukprot:PTQ41559.1 hypothetical protein MARPO_0034s0132 [Marchantia polymorpha]